MPFKTVSDCCNQKFLYHELYKGWCLQCSYQRMKKLEHELKRLERKHGKNKKV